MAARQAAARLVPLESGQALEQSSEVDTAFKVRLPAEARTANPMIQLVHVAASQSHAPCGQNAAKSEQDLRLSHGVAAIPTASVRVDLGER